MSDQERLDDIILRSFDDNGNMGVYYQDFDWLIQQAERVQELEKRLDAEVESGYQMEGQAHDAKAENKRLREALDWIEAAAREDEHGAQERVLIAIKDERRVLKGESE